MSEKIHTARINHPRNSKCSSAKLSDLDWSNWWTDDSNDHHYLHVVRACDDTVHRVWCKHHPKPRIKSLNGTIYWLYTKPSQPWKEPRP